MDLNKLNERMKSIIDEEFYEPLCTNDDYNVRETIYLAQIDIVELEGNLYEEMPKKLAKADGKYVVSGANYTYVDMINDGDYEEVLEIIGKTPTEAITKYWKHAIENDGEDICKEWFLMFECGQNAYWEEGQYADEFRSIGEKLLNITSADYEEESDWDNKEEEE